MTGKNSKEQQGEGYKRKDKKLQGGKGKGEREVKEHKGGITKSGNGKRKMQNRKTKEAEKIKQFK